MILISFLAFSPGSEAQDGIVQVQFSATKVSGKVFLDWTMNFGQTCNGIDITRSSDNLNFVPVGNIQGICGSPTDTVSYSFIDQSPLPNQINYYRLMMGNLGQSQTISVEIINIQGTGYQVRPNPIVDEGRIYFDNDRSEEYRLTVLSANGSILKQTLTRNDFFDVNTADLTTGIYFFTIESENGLEGAKGKFVVAR